MIEGCRCKLVEIKTSKGGTNFFQQSPGCCFKNPEPKCKPANESYPTYFGIKI